MIYLDNAATSMQKPPEVASAMTEALLSAGNAGRGVNSESLEAGRQVLETRSLLAELFHVPTPQRIAFTANATESLNIALKGFLRPGDHVITTQASHNSVLRPLYQLERSGVEVTILPCDPRGNLDLDVFQNAMRPETRAAVVSQISNVTGNILPLEPLAGILHARDAILIVDAAQSAGHISVDASPEKGVIDIVCFTGHKGLLGPQGTGGLYVREDIQLEPLLSGGTGVHSFDKAQPPAMPEHLEAGTLNGPGIAGLGASVRFLLAVGVDAVHEREQALTRRFVDGVTNIPGVRLYGNVHDPVRHGPVVSLNVDGLDAERVSDLLYTDFEISTRAGAHCAPLMHKALGTEKTGTVRFSFSYYTTDNDIDVALSALREIAEAVRNMSVDTKENKL